MEKVSGLWDEQFESVSNDEDIILCHMQPRVESLLQTVPVNWQSLGESEATVIDPRVR